LDAVDSNGCIPVPQGPGLGVAINWEWVERNRTNIIVFD
jgi:L-alanine-DL-glutamate epimerase-like enolase superfamily enzyme